MLQPLSVQSTREGNDGSGGARNVRKGRVVTARLAQAGIAVVVASLVGAAAVHARGEAGRGTAAITASAKPAPHRIGVRVVGGAAEFFDRRTGRRFVPRGPNYHRFEVTGGVVEDRTFAAWNGDLVAADFRAMRKLGYNTVRTALEICRHRCIGSPAGGLRPAYLDHLAQFLRLAKANGLEVLLQSNDLPQDGGYVPKVEATCCSIFDGYINAQYLSPTGYQVYRGYWTSVIRGLIARKAPLDVILGYGARGEMFFFADKPPLSLAGGSVKTANGRTYRLPQDRQRMIDEGTIFWLQGIRAAIRRLDPTALVGVGVFAPNDPYPWRPPPDTRAVFTEPILASGLDYYDVHPYPGGLPLDKLAANLRLSPALQAKPVIVGEYGGFHFAYPSPTQAAAALMDWQVASCAYGIDGWFHWHWRGANDPEVWTGTEGDGVINTVLAPSERPDPCVRKSFPFLERNLALGRPTSVSSSTPDSPGAGAVDGSRSTIWNSGAGAPGWIEIQLAAGSTVKEIRLAVGQTPNGHTVHRLLVRTGSGLQEVQRFAGDTSDDQTLLWRPSSPLAGVTAVRVETDESPSFVAWKEIEVIG
jgi:hypothetical protein